MNPTTLRLLTAAAIAASAAFSTPAATLEVAWTPDASQPNPSYRLHVGTQPGVYTRIVESKASHALLTDLADGQLYFMRVEQLASQKQSAEALAISAEIVSLPTPRIEAVGPFLPAGAADTWTFTVQGRNFAEGAAIRTNLPSLRILSTERDSAGQLLVTAHHEPEFGSVGMPALNAASLVVINPGRKAPEYYVARPERADVDGDGRVNQTDLTALRGQFGSIVTGVTGTGSESAASDLNGDGSVDGQDLDLLGGVIRGR